MPNNLSAARWATFVVGGTLLTTALAMPLPAIAKGHHDRPPGWSHGQKRGWNGRNEPPGQYRKHHGRDRDDRDRDDRDDDQDDRSGGYDNNGGYNNGGYNNGGYNNGGYYNGQQRGGSYRSSSPRRRQNPRIKVRQRSYRGQRYPQGPGYAPPSPPQIIIDQGRR
ncbi:MAG: hypothetical protein LC772_01305 [Chloroflexi bacterium]|nr:hypothetical protein [Chloroflexota bacterium]